MKHDVRFLGAATLCLFAATTVVCAAAGHEPVAPEIPGVTSQFLAWSTNGPAVHAIFRQTLRTNVVVSLAAVTTNSAGANGLTLSTNRTTHSYVTNMVVTNALFSHFLPQSLNHLVWTNFITHTNGRSTMIWSAREHPVAWPAAAPVAAWNKNSLIRGMKGMTALSPCWEVEGGAGQIPITALTRRHGYARGHGMGSDGMTTNRFGKKIWFLTANNAVVEVKILRDIVRTGLGGAQRDYTIMLFDQDLPASIAPMHVALPSEVHARYPNAVRAPHPVFRSEQSGHVSAEIPGFTVSTWKGGDSGAPDMLAMPGELVFFGGRSTSGPSRKMQADVDALSISAGLNTNRYQLQWVDLSGFPAY